MMFAALKRLSTGVIATLAAIAGAVVAGGVVVCAMLVFYQGIPIPLPFVDPDPRIGGALPKAVIAAEERARDDAEEQCLANDRQAELDELRRQLGATAIVLEETRRRAEALRTNETNLKERIDALQFAEDDSSRITADDARRLFGAWQLRGTDGGDG